MNSETNYYFGGDDYDLLKWCGTKYPILDCREKQGSVTIVQGTGIVLELIKEDQLKQLVKT